MPMHPPTFRQMSQRLQLRFDTVLWDMPPPATNSPTAIAAELMDGVILVVEAGHTTRSALSFAANRIRDNNGRLLGVVMNRVRRREVEGAME